MKVCSLYGAGFYYIPGTDICMKIGGFVRYQQNYGGGGHTPGPFGGAQGFANRANTTDWAGRVRAIATFDTRQQTAYGTLRTYLLMGFTQDTNANSGADARAGFSTPVYMTRAFIQIAGFTFGKATSFFDFASTAAVAYNAGYTHSPDTGDPGWLVGAYTAQLGNGVSATISMEQSRRNNTVYMPDITAAGMFSAAWVGANNQGANTVAQVSGLPDIVGNVRVDQAWGSAMVAAAAHNVNAAYYGRGAPGNNVTTPGVDANGHPGDKWGWAVTGGLRLNAPMIGPGDYFQAQVSYSQGATRYVSFTPGNTFQQYWQGTDFAFAQYADATFSGTALGAGGAAGTNNFGNTINLTTAFGVFASYEHFWTPALRTSLYGSYVHISYNDNAKAQFCTRVSQELATGNTQFLGCSPNSSSMGIGSRTQWNVTKDFYVGIDVMYNKLQSASLGSSGLNNGRLFLTNAQIGTTSGKATGFYHNSDQDVVTATWRVHRDIVP